MKSLKEYLEMWGDGTPLNSVIEQVNVDFHLTHTRPIRPLRPAVPQKQTYETLSAYAESVRQYEEQKSLYEKKIKEYNREMQTRDSIFRNLIRDCSDLKCIPEEYREKTLTYITSRTSSWFEIIDEISYIHQEIFS